MSVQLRIADLVNDSIVDGPGIRFTVFTQGCPHRCPGCHNPQTHDPHGGRMIDIDTIYQKIAANPLLDGLTLSGGDPFEQAAPLAALCARVRTLGLNIWAYTGYTWEALQARPADDPVHALLTQIDVLVDGPFILAQRSLEIPFRGSANQRLIDVPASLAQHTLVLWSAT